MADVLDMLRYGRSPLQSTVADTPAPAVAPMSMFDRIFGHVDPKTGIEQKGMAAPILGAVSGLGKTWLGMKQYGLAKDSFDFNKKAWSRDFAMQKNLVNSELSDRQRARVASNPGAYDSEAAYMSKYGVK